MRIRNMLLVAAMLAAGAADVIGEERAAAHKARGIVRAAIHSTISTELVAEVQSLPFKAGESFAKGSILVRFDCARYAAELRAAEAEFEAARLEVKANQKLLSRRAIGGLEVEISQAKKAQMQARLEALQVRRRQCTIHAPFAGDVVQRHIQPFEMSQPGGALIEVVNQELEVDIIVPSEWLAWLKPKTAFSFRIDENRQTYAGQISRLGAVVDPISRTVRLVGQIDIEGEAVRPGMSGTAVFQKRTTMSGG